MITYCSFEPLYCCCRWVDEVVKDAPWVLDIDFINKHKIDFVTHDALPYSDASGQANDVYDFVSAHCRSHTFAAAEVCQYNCLRLRCRSRS